MRFFPDINAKFYELKKTYDQPPPPFDAASMLLIYILYRPFIRVIY